MTTQANDHVQMTVAEILKDLELCTGVFPRRAVQQAIEQQEAITPHLLGVLEEVAAKVANMRRTSKVSESAPHELGRSN
jgi:hypothetical protein